MRLDSQSLTDCRAQLTKMAQPPSLYPPPPTGGLTQPSAAAELRMPRRGTPDSDASKDAVVCGNNSAFPVAVPVNLDEEPEMQAQPGIFTNQRGNLKVRACVTSRLSAPLHASVPACRSLNSLRVPR
jgi:hypothetical protein